ncbi:hypothetical protein BJ322DRAFT_1184210 [Thelephora terrestris]|uniref:RING-type domain-containing protein n=1 Tax=Thelephora terrestris TaxID=56493 RepID=A0A9P6H1W9_9AGAM|nr:hypothetical protein BJ322DRAFT_1184210 [Thelephora terrestris]
MSLNKPGGIVGQVVHPRATSSDQAQKRHRDSTVSTEDFIEISSDEDDLQPPQKKALTKRGKLLSAESDYEAELFDKQQEIEKLKTRERELEQVVAMQKKEIAARESPAIIDKIEEELTCDLCTVSMWSPYRLMECGHVFCLACLLSWFDDIHVRFVNSHQGYSLVSPHLRAFLGQPLEFPEECYRAYLHMAKFPGPQYSCPSCRAVVTRRPVEDFKVKMLVSYLGSFRGIKPPEPRNPPGTGETAFDGYSLI